jgi:hypothetical protein
LLFISIKISVQRSILAYTRTLVLDHTDDTASPADRQIESEPFMRPTTSPTRTLGTGAHLLETLSTIALLHCAMSTVLTTVAARTTSCRQTPDA